MGLLNLRHLYAEYAGIAGTIPEELYLNKALQNVLLNDNKLSGTISTHIGQMKSLGRFEVDGNELSGTLPEEISQLTKLEYLHIQRNIHVMGAIPAKLCDNTIQGYEIAADCTPTASTGEPAIFCPAGCCTTCCDAETGICLDQ